MPVLRYRRRYLRCEVPRPDRARLVAAVEQLPAAMGGQFHNLNIKPMNTRRAVCTGCGSATTA